MMTVARTGVLNRGSVFPNWRGSTPSEPIAKVTRTPDTRLARVDPRADRPRPGSCTWPAPSRRSPGRCRTARCRRWPPGPWCARHLARAKVKNAYISASTITEATTDWPASPWYRRRNICSRRHDRVERVLHGGRAKGVQPYPRRPPGPRPGHPGIRRPPPGRLQVGDRRFQSSTKAGTSFLSLLPPPHALVVVGVSPVMEKSLLAASRGRWKYSERMMNRATNSRTRPRATMPTSDQSWLAGASWMDR
jgi:hypothetical protein